MGVREMILAEKSDGRRCGGVVLIDLRFSPSGRPISHDTVDEVATCASNVLSLDDDREPSFARASRVGRRHLAFLDFLWSPGLDALDI